MVAAVRLRTKAEPVTTMTLPVKSAAAAILDCVVRCCVLLDDFSSQPARPAHRVRPQCSGGGVGRPAARGNITRYIDSYYYIARSTKTKKVGNDFLHFIDHATSPRVGATRWCTPRAGCAGTSVAEAGRNGARRARPARYMHHFGIRMAKMPSAHAS
jgi:hypothetical protein